MSCRDLDHGFIRQFDTFRILRDAAKHANCRLNIGGIATGKQLRTGLLSSPAKFRGKGGPRLREMHRFRPAICFPDAPFHIALLLEHIEHPDYRGSVRAHEAGELLLRGAFSARNQVAQHGDVGGGPGMETGKSPKDGAPKVKVAFGFWSGKRD